MTEPTGPLLMMSIGPIQDFIASARRCQDLWFGSWLLSDLSHTLKDHVLRATSKESVVFPAPSDDPESRPGVANILIAQLPAGFSISLVDAIARAGQAAVVRRLQEVAESAWKDVPEHLFHRNVARAQLDDLIEVLWVVVEKPTSYCDRRNEAARRLAAIKNTRLWTQPTWNGRAGAGVPKSSLDGERESVIDEKVYPKPGKTEGGWKNAEARRLAFGIKGGERLCGVGLLKRLGAEMDDENAVYRKGRPGRPAFHSTSHVAMIPTIRRLSKHPAGPMAMERYLTRLDELGLDLNRFRIRPERRPALRMGRDHFDGVLLLESRLADHFAESAVPPEAVLEKVKQATDALRELLRTTRDTTPCPYYAFLLADGDNMGKSIDALKSEDHHRNLGAALNDFAEACQDIVTKNEGTLIFSGGDDVLALLPLDKAVGCARDLAEAFKTQVDGALDEMLGTDHKDKATLSVGLGITHCREPMSEARAVAMRAEKAAKAVKDKGALCIIVDKRSGGDLQVVGRWSDPAPLHTALNHWLSLIAEGAVSAKTPHDLEMVADHYAHLPLDAQRDRLDEIASLCAQVLERKRRVGGSTMKATDKDHIKARLDREGLKRPDQPLAPASAIRHLAHELQIARLIHQAGASLGTTGANPSQDGSDA